MENAFSKFTNLYALSKTLRFELKPVGKTQAMLEEAKVFKKDETMQKKYEQTKPYFDRLHREFVKEALKNAVLSNLSGYFEIFEKWKNDKKDNEKELQKKENELRLELVKFFDAQAGVWVKKYSHLRIKKKDIGLLFEEDVFAILKERYGSESETQIIDNGTGKSVSIFDSWKGFIGYFTKFFETRKNFYKADGTSTALATRIIDQNLKRFCDNLVLFTGVKEKIDFSEVEESFGKSLAEVFSVSFYSECLLQDGIDFYNTILGGKTLESGEKQKGLNELINKYRQDHKGEKLAFFKSLDKQILSEKEKFIYEIENDAQLFDMLRNFQKSAEEKTKIARSLFGDFIKNQDKYDLLKIYFSRESLNTIAHKWTGETDIFEEALFDTLKNAKIISSSDKKNDGGYSFPDFIALSFVKEALERIPAEKFWKERYYKNYEDYASKGFLIEGEKMWKQFLDIFEFEFLSLFEREIIDTETKEVKKIGYDIFKDEFENLLNHFKVDQDAKTIIKNFADSVLTIYQMAKYFSVEKKRGWLTDYELDTFYTNPQNGYFEKFYQNAYEEIVQVYNKLRNYLTKKPYSEEKWKLNFMNPTLADGWDKNKESANSSVILRKDGKYFLGIMANGHNKIFGDRFVEKFSRDIEQEKYEKMVYKLLPGANKMLPKVFFSASNIDFYSPSEKVMEIRNHSTHTKNGTSQNGFKKKDFNLLDCHILIDFFKDSIAKHPDWKEFDFHFSETRKYLDISDFYREVEEGGYKINFQNISESYINEKQDNGELYLFQINNKDWNLDKARDGKRKTSQKNLHTLYFESLFSAGNIAQNFPMKLNGQAEIFYRPKTEVEKLGVKKDRQGKEVVNHKRYSENKIFFHVPLTLNRTKRSPFYFNANINDFLANNPSINIIGVDRGEKHLAYFSIISQKGEIIESGSLNSVRGGNNQEINYAEKLEEKAKNREQARKDWQAVEGIKDLKRGYISQVVRKLADLAIKHNAIIVFEDLNMRFKQIRSGIEKSVYQQLEKALIEKLNFLVQKGENDPKKAGHLLRAYQLTAPFETFQKMGKQTGILFYTQAAYTSRIDPVTGWRPHLYLKYSSAEKAKMDILKFSKIEFANERFEFTYDIKIFQDQKEYPKNTIWTVCSCVERFRWDKSLNQTKGGYTRYEDVTRNLKEFFNLYGIDFEQGNILGKIKNLEVKGNEKFFRDFIFLFNLICQIRNTDDSEKAKKEGKNDFILSPVEPFFDSRISEKFGKNLPQNGDDNGAYNIARKGIIVLGKISDFAKKNGGCKKIKWGNLYVSNTEWDDYGTKK